MEKIIKKENCTRKNGSVLILALVLTSILLSVGMGISGIAMKEIKLSSIGNESGKAFYMADTGAECALYWDSKDYAIKGKYVFATSSVPGNYVKPPGDTTTVGNIRCFNGVDITTSSWNVFTGSSPVRAITTFWLIDPDPSKPCAVVEVEKRYDNLTNSFTTDIDSRGRSSCDTNPRRVERGLKVSY